MSGDERTWTLDMRTATIAIIVAGPTLRPRERVDVVPAEWKHRALAAEAALAAARQVDDAAPVKLARTLGYETIAELGNGIQLESYWPDDREEPIFALRQTGYPAYLRPDQIAPLRAALGALLAALNTPEPEGERPADEHVRLEAERDRAVAMAQELNARLAEKCAELAALRQEHADLIAILGEDADGRIDFDAIERDESIDDPCALCGWTLRGHKYVYGTARGLAHLHCSHTLRRVELNEAEAKLARLREAAQTLLDVAAVVGAGPSEFAALRAALASGESERSEG